MKGFLILTGALIFSGLILSACATSRTTDEQERAGEVQHSAPENDNKPTENNSDESKKVAEKETLWDFRKEDDFRVPEFSKAETDAVVKYLFGDRASGKIEIRNRLTGAFTKPNTKETLYYLSGCKDETSGQFTTDCPHVSWDTQGWIAIYDGTTPVAKINQPLGGTVGKTTDVNGDGKNEFLSFGGYAQSGIQTQSVSIGQISGGKYKNINTFSVYAYNCASGGNAKNTAAKAAVISYIPTTDHKIPEFTEEFFQAECKPGDADSGSAFDLIKQSSWKKITKKEFDEFYESLS